MSLMSGALQQGQSRSLWKLSKLWPHTLSETVLRSRETRQSNILNLATPATIHYTECHYFFIIIIITITIIIIIIKLLL